MARCFAFWEKHKFTILFILILIMSLCAMIYFGHQKQGYHVDELYSYGLSNSEYLPFMHFGESGYDVKDWMNEYGAGESFADLFSNLLKDFRILKECDFDFYKSEIYQAYRTAQANSADTYTTTWVSGQDYVDYLAVNESNTFNYASVYYNQRGDVHPPLFYILLHTICSIFQGQFSKWFGLGLNIVILLIVLVVLYRMCLRHIGGAGVALAVVACYAFSSGFMSTAMFIRMYSLLTFMTILCTYVHLEIVKHDYTMNRRLIIALFLSVLGGYYTQYYFVLYALGIAAVMLGAMLLKRKWRSCVTYVLTLLAAAVTGIVIWPFSIKHVFGGYRGQASLEILKNGNFYSYKAKYMLGHIANYVFGGFLWVPIVLLIVSAGICIYLKRKKLPYAKICILTFPVILYTLVVGQISPFLTDRYVMCTYPFWCIIIVSVVYSAFRYLLEYFEPKLTHSSRNIRRFILIVYTILLFSVNNYFSNTPGYLNPNGQEIYQVPEGTDCVFIIPNGSYNESSEELCILAQCENVGVVYESNIGILAEDYIYQTGDYLLVEIINHLDTEKVLLNVQEALQVTELRELERTYGSNCVRILLGQ